MCLKFKDGQIIKPAQNLTGKITETIKLDDQKLIEEVGRMAIESLRALPTDSRVFINANIFLYTILGHLILNEVVTNS